MIDLIVHGPPRGKGRPRFQRATGHAYTDEATMSAEGRIQTAWIHAGRPRLEDGPLAMHVELVLDRPQSHVRRDGTLTPAGERLPWPLRKPDADNALKLVADALNGAAYRDDVQIVHATVVRRWTKPGEHAHTRIVLQPVAAVVRAPGQLELAA